MKNRVTTKIVAAAIAATLLASCGQQGNTNSQNYETGNQETPGSEVVENSEPSESNENLSGRELLEKLHDQVINEVGVDYDEFLTLGEFDYEDDMYHSHSWIREDGYHSWKYYYWTMPIDEGGHLVVYLYIDDESGEHFKAFVYKNGKLSDGSGYLPSRETVAEAIGKQPGELADKINFLTDACGHIDAAADINGIIYNQAYNWNGSQFVEYSGTSSLQLED